MTTKKVKIDVLSNNAIKTESGKIGKSARTRDPGSGQLLTTGGGKSSRTKSTSVVVGKDPLPPKDRRNVTKASVDSAGRILVPVKLRKALNIEPGDDVNLVLKGGVLEVRSLDDAINEAQSLVRKHVPKKRSLVNELIAERRAEAAKE